MLRLLVTSNVVSSTPILAILMMEALLSLKLGSYKSRKALASQETAFFIVTAVKPPNYTTFYFHGI
jgi:hypothetical protein